MRCALIILLIHLITTILRLVRAGGLRSVVAESVLIKYQLVIMNRSHRRAPNLRVLDRLIAGLFAVDEPKRLLRSAVALKPIHSFEFPSRSDSAQIAFAVFAEASREAWAKRPKSGSDFV